jgi:hypothetical protein
MIYKMKCVLFSFRNVHGIFGEDIDESVLGAADIPRAKPECQSYGKYVVKLGRHQATCLTYQQEMAEEGS